LFGLKQAPRACFAKFNSTIAHIRFVSSPYDSTLFIRRSNASLILRLLYVDDMIITRDDTIVICNLQQFLSQQFHMKDLGFFSYFLGLEVSSYSNGYHPTQAKYTSNLLPQAGLTDYKIVDSPLETNVKLHALDGELVSDFTLYQQLVGSLIYLTMTRPDLAYTVYLVSQFMTVPDSVHYAPVLCILRYMKGTLFHGLHFACHSSLDLNIYSHANWACDPTNLWVIVSYLVILSSLGVARHSLLLPALAMKLSIVLLLTPPLSSSGSVGSYIIWVYLHYHLDFEGDIRIYYDFYPYC
jgi:hypothetical protein